MLTFAMISPGEVGIVAAVVLVLFGGAKIAGFGRSIGQGIRGFKEEVNAPDKPATPSVESSPSQTPPA